VPIKESLFMHNAVDSERIEIMNYMKDTFHNDLKKDVLLGLTSYQKAIPSKYFYDEYGSMLFEEICGLPEYYQTRTEISILKRSAVHIIRNPGELDIVELGSGANLKIRTLLDACFKKCQADICYVPVDVSESALVEASVELLEFYSNLKIVGIVADFTKHIEEIPTGRKRLFVFFGSTIGNFSCRERVGLLKSVAGKMNSNDRFLLGIDMIKPSDVLERAYNDTRGVTAEFNKNILKVLNRELNSDFDLSHFDHVAFYDADKEQVEMHLRANRSIVAEINGLGMQVSIEKGETIHTEICGKFSRESAEAMAEEAGLRIDRWYSDHQGWFSLVELSRTDQEYV
jgi:L-histidine N-alpha-methyltransferase